MVKIIIVLIAIHYFIFLCTIKNKISKTISKNKSTDSLINNCCQTHFHLLRMVLRSFIRRNIFIFLLHLEYKVALNKILN